MKFDKMPNILEKFENLRKNDFYRKKVYYSNEKFENQKIVDKMSKFLKILKL